jgi:hypothetical protein
MTAQRALSEIRICIEKNKGENKGKDKAAKDKGNDIRAER